MTFDDSLDTGACWAHLRSAVVGRVAAVIDEQVTIRPANYAVDHGTLLIRTGPGTALARMSGLQVAFEADGLESGTEPQPNLMAWSVIVTAHAHVIVGTDELVETLQVPVLPWQASAKPVLLRLDPQSVTGRRFTVADPSRWVSDLSRVRPASSE